MATITAVAAARGGQRRSLPLPDDPTPQQLREWVLQRARPGGGGFGLLCTAQRRQQSQQETFSPQVLSELFPQRCVTSFVEAAALGASESAAPLGASEYAAALGARASPATCPSSAEALLTHTTCCTGTGLHLPTFSTNLVSNAAIQNVWVDTFIPEGRRVAICTCSRTGRHLATFTRRHGSSLYTLTTASAQVAAAGQVAASSQVSASGQLAASCLCRVLSHQTLLWHHHLGHPSLPRLRGMHSRFLVSGLPRSLPSLPRSPAPPWLPCVEGRQRAAPHSSEFPLTTTPLKTLHMDVWGPAPIGGTDQERYFLLVVDDYTCYTSVFHLRRKADVSGVLIPWIRATRRQLRERFSRDFSVLRLHSNRGGEFSSDLLVEFCRDEGIVQSFTLPASPQQIGIAERRIGLIMERPRPHSVFQVWGAFSLFRDAKASKLSSRTLHCVFLGFPTDAPPWQFYHPCSRRVFSSQDVTFDESGPAPSCVSQVDLPPLVEPLEVSSDSSGLVEGGDPAADDTAATRRSPRLPADVDSGAETAGAESGGAKPKGEGSGGASCGCATTGGADSGGPASPSGGGAVGDPAGGPGAGQPPQPELLETLLPQAFHAWIVRQGSPGGGGYGPAGVGVASPGGTAGAGGTGGAASAGGTRGAAGAGGAGATSPRGATGAAGAGPTSPGCIASAGGAGGIAGARGTGGGGTGGAGAAGPGGARRGGAGAARAGGTTGAGGAGGATGAVGTGGAGGTTGARGPPTAGASGANGAGGAGGAVGAAGAGGASAVGAGGAGGAGTALCIPFFYPQPQSSLPPPNSVLRQRCEPETRASTPVRARRVARPRPPAVPGTHGMALCPSSVPHRVVLPEPPTSSFPHISDPESDLARAASHTVTRLLTAVVTDPDLESTAAFALVTELVNFAARSCLDYVASFVNEYESVCPPSVGGELALGSDVLEDNQFELECLAATLPRFASMLLCHEGDPDALDIPTPRSYAEVIAGEYSS
ncbi:unnamed protein product [Closterium sp. NIES-54]